VSNSSETRLSVIGPPRTLAAIVAILAAKPSSLAPNDRDELRKPVRNADVATYHFRRRWGPPIDAIEHLSLDWPNALFAVSWYEESPSRGRVLIEAGKTKSLDDELVPSPLYTEDHWPWHLLETHDDWVTSFHREVEAKGRLGVDWDDFVDEMRCV
jgi:hypothetical protein